MKIIKLIYNQESSYLTQIIKNLAGNNLTEFFNIDYNSDKKEMQRNNDKIWDKKMSHLLSLQMRISKNMMLFGVNPIQIGN